MVVDAVRAYFEAVNGLTELTRKRAVAAAKVILKTADERSAAPSAGGARPAPPEGESGDGAARDGAARGGSGGSGIQTLAGELIEASEANRAALTALVGSEVERALERMELVGRADYDRLARRVAELERRLAAQRPLGGAAPVHAAVAPAAADSAEDTGAEHRPPAGAGPAADRSGDPPGPAPSARVPAADEPAGPVAATGSAAEPEEGVRDGDPGGASAGEDGAQAGAASASAETAETAQGAVGDAPAQEDRRATERSDAAQDTEQDAEQDAENAHAAGNQAAASGNGRQQRSAKAKSGSGRSGGTPAKTGGAKRPANRGKNSTKNDR